MAEPDNFAHTPVSEEFWDDWNKRWRFRPDIDHFMRQQLSIAAELAASISTKPLRILGMGCGTGWLENGLTAFGEVWGTDLSPGAITEGSKRYPDVKLQCCDFLKFEFPDPFDMIVSADSLVPMAEHQLCIDRVAGLLRPGGMFLLMTQNPIVWSRRSSFEKVAHHIPHADPRVWPTKSRIRSMLDSSFVVERAFSFDPGGDQGLLCWVESGFLRSAMESLIGTYRWQRVLERAGLGRELVFVARRRDTIWR